MTRAHTLETMNLNTTLLYIGPVLYHKIQSTCHDCEQRLWNTREG